MLKSPENVKQSWLRKSSLYGTKLFGYTKAHQKNYSFIFLSVLSFYGA